MDPHSLTALNEHHRRDLVADAELNRLSCAARTQARALRMRRRAERLLARADRLGRG